MPLTEPPTSALSRRTLLGAIALPLLPSIAHAAPLDQALEALVNDPGRPLASLSVQVQREGQVVYEAQWGRRHVALDLPVTRDTLFRIASVTKLVVAVAVMRLVETDALALDTDLGGLLGYSLYRPLTPRLLLSHRSGLSDQGNDYTNPRLDLKSLLRQSGPAWNGRAPGSWFEYANLNYVVLAAAMERATGQRFDHLMQRLVLGPLAMQGGFDVARLPAQQREQVATLYRKAPSDLGPWQSQGPWISQTDDVHSHPPQALLPDGVEYTPGTQGGLFGPQGRLRTRVCDLGTLMAMLLNEGRTRSGRFLRPDSVRSLMSECWRSDGRNGDDGGGLFQAWGVGLQHFIDRSRDHWGDRLIAAGGLHAWGHLGFAYGLVSGLLIAPERRCGIIYAIGGTGADPAAHPGRYSSFPLWEERLQDLLWAEALRS